MVPVHPLTLRFRQIAPNQDLSPVKPILYRLRDDLPFRPVQPRITQRCHRTMTSLRQLIAIALDQSENLT